MNATQLIVGGVGEDFCTFKKQMGKKLQKFKIQKKHFETDAIHNGGTKMIKEK